MSLTLTEGSAFSPTDLRSLLRLVAAAATGHEEDHGGDDHADGAIGEPVRVRVRDAIDAVAGEVQVGAEQTGVRITADARRHELIAAPGQGERHGHGRREVAMAVSSASAEVLMEAELIRVEVDGYLRTRQEARPGDRDHDRVPGEVEREGEIGVVGRGRGR